MQRDQQHQGAHKKIDRMWREERSHLPLQTSRSESVVVRQKPSFFFCACRSIRTRISQLLSDWFNIRQAARQHANPICGACDGWAGGQCAGTNHSADDASATGLAHHLLAFHTSAFFHILHGRLPGRPELLHQPDLVPDVPKLGCSSGAVVATQEAPFYSSRAQILRQRLQSWN
jgi:hypothetical protein